MVYTGLPPSLLLVLPALLPPFFLLVLPALLPAVLHCSEGPGRPLLLFYTVLRVSGRPPFAVLHCSEGPREASFSLFSTVLRVLGRPLLAVFNSSEGPREDSSEYI